MSISVEEFLQMREKANNQALVTKHKTQPEHEMQVACLQWFYSTFPAFSNLIWATPNAARRSKRTAAILKAEGMKAGVPDLFLAVPRKHYHGMFLELKNGKKNNPTEKQKAMLEALTDQGYQCHVCRSFDEFKKYTKEYLYV